jgi:hypothetical protein
VISPHIRVLDVEPDGFGVLCALARRRDLPTRGELHVLHDRGTVLRVVHTHDGPTMDHRADLGSDLPAAAARLRAAADVDRVVLVDRDQLVALAPQLAAAGPSDIDQPTMFRRSTSTFWSSAAVVTDPAAPDPSSWERLTEHLRGLGDDYWGLLAGYDGDRCAFTVLGRFVEGRLALMTSLRGALGDARPPVARADELVTAAQTHGPLPFVLIAPIEVLHDVAVAADLPTALSACAPRALISRGLPR